METFYICRQFAVPTCKSLGLAKMMKKKSEISVTFVLLIVIRFIQLFELNYSKSKVFFLIILVTRARRMD